MMFQRPRCRYCNKKWTPPAGVVAQRAYCTDCRSGRRAEAVAALGARKITADDLVGPYLLPRALRRIRGTT